MSSFDQCQIARAVSDMSTVQLHHHLRQLEKFADILSRGKEYNITEMTEGCGIYCLIYILTHRKPTGVAEIA